MNYKKEVFSFGDTHHFRLFQIAERQLQLHCHNCLELNLVEKGRGKYIIGGKLYPIEPGDIFVINNSERHLAIHDEEELALTVVVFDSDYIWRTQHGKNYLKPFFQRKDNFSHRISPGAESYSQMLYTFECMKQEAEGERIGRQMVMEAAANLLLSLLYRHYYEKQEVGEEGEQQSTFGCISSVFSYIDEHFAEEITLEALARVSSMSKTYLCKCFKDMTGQTLFGYIEQIRIQYACYLLQTSRRLISEIAMEAGFSSISYFNSLFKKSCGVTPGQFRKGAGAAPTQRTNEARRPS